MNAFWTLLTPLEMASIFSGKMTVKSKARGRKDINFRFLLPYHPKVKIRATRAFAWWIPSSHYSPDYLSEIRQRAARGHLALFKFNLPHRADVKLVVCLERL